MRAFSIIILGITCLLSTACLTAPRKAGSNSMADVPSISFVVQCRNDLSGGPDILSVIGQLGRIYKMIISEKEFAISEIHITCIEMSDKEVREIQQRLWQIAAVLNVIILRT